MAPVLGCWKMRSCGQCIRLILTYADEKYEDKVYDFGPAPDFSRMEWVKDKFSLDLDFPNLPYYIDGDVKLSLNYTIIKYLSRKHKLDGRTEDERIRVHIMEHQLHDLYSKWAQLCYDENFELERVAYLGQLHNELRYISEFLEKNKYFAGDNVTFVDFMAYEFFSQHQVLQSGCLDSFDNLKEFQNKIEALPGVGDFIKTSPTFKHPIYEPTAYFGNQ